MKAQINLTRQKLKVEKVVNLLEGEVFCMLDEAEREDPPPLYILIQITEESGVEEEGDGGREYAVCLENFQLVEFEPDDKVIKFPHVEINVPFPASICEMLPANDHIEVYAQNER